MPEIAGSTLFCGGATTAAVGNEVSVVADGPPKFDAVSTISMVEPTSGSPKRYVGAEMPVDAQVPPVHRHHTSVYPVGALVQTAVNCGQRLT